MSQSFIFPHPPEDEKIIIIIIIIKIKRINPKLSERNFRFTICFCCTSGTVTAPPVALDLRCP